MQGLNPKKNPEDKKVMVQSLARSISLDLSKNLMIMPTAMVSAVLLQHRRGITNEDLVKQIKWLGKELQERGVILPDYSLHPVNCVKHGLRHLNQ